MKLTQEMIIALIGMVGVLISAILSLISISRTNKNQKNIENLKNSEDVKKDFADKRYKAYSKLIDYVNSWYNVKPCFSHDVLHCDAHKFLHGNLFEHRLNTIDDVKKEYEKIAELSQGYFYYDKKTYFYLKTIESYLLMIIECNNIIKPKKYKVFTYIVYCDLWKFVVKLSKFINKYIKSKDSLKFTHHKREINFEVGKEVDKTDFTNIYIECVLSKKLANDLKKEVLKSQNKYKNKIKSIEGDLENEDNPKVREMLLKQILICKKGIKRLDKIRLKSKAKIKHNDMFKLWSICENCDNKRCVFNSKD